jgi:hypothetical protein
VLDRAVAEVALLAEQLAVVGGDGDVGVRRQEVEEAREDAIEIAHGVDLARPQAVELRPIELRRRLALDQLAADHLAIEVLEDAVHAGDARPLARVLARQGEGIVRLADVEQPERRSFGVEAQPFEHRRHVVVGRHEHERVEVAIDRGGRVEHRQRDQRVGAVAVLVLQERGQVERRQQLVELDAVGAEALIVAREIPLVVLRRVDVRRAGVRQQAHEQVVVRRGRPRGVAPAPLERTEAQNRQRVGRDEAVEAATVEDDQQVVVHRAYSCSTRHRSAARFVAYPLVR